MIPNKTTRSAVKSEENVPKVQLNTAIGFNKVFFIPESYLKESNNLVLECFLHPSKERPVFYLTCSKTKEVQEVLEFSEPRRSWFIDNEVSSNGRLYITTPVDPIFLALHHLRKHCSDKAMALDNIHVERDPTVSRLLTTFIDEEHLKCVTDVKYSGETRFYKYNPEKTLAWLAIKTRRVADVLKYTSVHCGHSSSSQNYVRVDQASDESVQEIDYLRMACDIVGDSIELDLHEELIRYFNIPSENIQNKIDDTNGVKRKSLQTLKSTNTKKIKLDENEGVIEKLKNSSLLDESLDENGDNSIQKLPQLDGMKVPKEKSLTAKEKALAKGAKGTKSIASFFKK